MPTWALIITLLADSRVVGITSVPGYSSPDACHDAGEQYKSLELFEGYNVKYVCIGGPAK
jgi:hypothetical protein